MTGDDARGPMRIEWDVAAPMGADASLRVDVFRPAEDGFFPALVDRAPPGLDDRDQATRDAELWVAEGYVCVRLHGRMQDDAAAAGATDDLRSCIEWAAHQPWSNSRVGLGALTDGGAGQWLDAATQAPHLAAICVWEGAADPAREISHHGGIPSALAVDREEAPDWRKITAPLLSAANWGGHGSHTRGNLEGFSLAASREKWLEAHGLGPGAHFGSPAGRRLRRKFFDHFLKGEDSGWDDQPPVLLQIRHPDRFEERGETAWPISRTIWTRCYLDLDQDIMGPDVTNHTATRTFDAMGDGLTFLTEPLSDATELTGPMAARLYISSSTADADIFVVVRVFTADLREVSFEGAVDPRMPVAQGWLRASCRKLDRRLSLPHRPCHTHDERQMLAPGEIAELDIEIWPASIAIPAGHRIGLSIRGRDYEHAAGGGCGAVRHDGRPADVFAGETTLHADDGHRPFVLLPVIPPA